MPAEFQEAGFPAEYQSLSLKMEDSSPESHPILNPEKLAPQLRQRAEDLLRKVEVVRNRNIQTDPDGATTPNISFTRTLKGKAGETDVILRAIGEIDESIENSPIQIEVVETDQKRGFFKTTIITRDIVLDLKPLMANWPTSTVFQIVDGKRNPLPGNDRYNISFFTDLVNQAFPVLETSNISEFPEQPQAKQQAAEQEDTKAA